MDVPTLRPRDPRLQPPALTPGYKTTVARSPRQPLLSIATSLTEATGPVFGDADLGRLDHDLIQNWSQGGLAIGERIFVHGRVLDQDARPQAGVLVEVWQANAGGRYRHKTDSYLAPLDPNFGGCGRTLTDAAGRYWFHTIRPGPYPWPNGTNTWRPAHIHVSILGPSLGQRLITQMYFEGDPLIPLCPIVATIPDPAAIDRLVARLDMGAARPFDSLAYRFDVVIRGPLATFFENRREGL